MTKTAYDKACMTIGWMQEIEKMILTKSYDTEAIIKELKELIEELEK
jgi:hypothetical protein